jgi:two-component system, sensor histidine kinase PdtaS
LIPKSWRRRRDYLPADIDLVHLVGRGNQVIRGIDRQGRRATFVVAELIPRRLYALGTWPEGSAGPTGVRAIIVPMLFPVLMWVASLGVLYFAVYQLVIRHVRALNRQMRRFALGTGTPRRICRTRRRLSCANSAAPSAR